MTEPPDPGIADELLRIEEAAMYSAQTQFSSQRAQQADARDDVTEALRQWRIVFGDEFPGYGPSPAKLRLKRPA